MKANKTWFTSDHHFGHTNILKYAKRPFDSIEEMDAELVKRWNEVVQPRDVIYHLGDFSLNGLKDVLPILVSLNGSINFIPGCHDKWIEEYIKNRVRLPRVIILSRFEMLNIYNDDILKTLTLCHYPMLQWPSSYHRSIHLHGHTHGNIGFIGNSQYEGGASGWRLDVGVDCNNFYPFDFQDIKSCIESNS